MTPADRQLIDETFAEGRTYLARHHSVGFGIFPSADPRSNYFNQVWARDSAHAAAHYFVRENPQAVIDSLATFFRHQLESGALPSRVEREYQLLKLTPGFRWLAAPAFRIIEKRLRNRMERPVHEGKDSAGGEDTVPVVLIAAGELFFEGGAEGRAFVTKNFAALKKAAAFFAIRIDPADGLAIATHDNPDWADTIVRKGKLGGINVLWARGLKYVRDIARELGDADDEKFYDELFEKTRRGVMEKLYISRIKKYADSDVAERDSFFRAEAQDDRLDAVATIFGAQYFLTSEEAVDVERTLKRRVEHSSGLQNFDPPYAQKDIYWLHRLLGQWLYHNKFVWPWVTGQNILVKIKIGRGHSNEAMRETFQREAVEDLIKLARLFKEGGGAYEVFEPDEPRRGETPYYKPPKYFMGSLASYQGAYAALKALGWI
jgi:glycogen debranching enzyme